MLKTWPRRRCRMRGRIRCISALRPNTLASNCARRDTRSRRCSRARRSRRNEIAPARRHLRSKRVGDVERQRQRALVVPAGEIRQAVGLACGHHRAPATFEHGFGERTADAGRYAGNEPHGRKTSPPVPMDRCLQRWPHFMPQVNCAPTLIRSFPCRRQAMPLHGA